MEVEIKKKSGFTIIGMVESGTDGPKFIPPLWQRFIKNETEVLKMRSQGGAYGVMRCDGGEGKPFLYLAGMIVPSDAKPPEGMDKWEVPDQEYAVVRCTLPKLFEAYDLIYKEWLPASEYERAPGEEFEEYLEGYCYEDDSDPMNLWVPIAKK